MDLSDYDALSFDCYGTLIDWEQGIGSVLSAWAQQAGLKRDREFLLAVYSAHEARIARETPTMLYSGVLAASFTALGEELSTAVSPEWAARLGASVPDWPAFPDSHCAPRSASARANCSTSRRASSTTTSPPRRRAFRRCGSTAATTSPAGAQPRNRRPR